MSKPNPVIAEIKRGKITESIHRGAFAIADESGNLKAHSGDIAKPFYPRSAIKAFQLYPLLNSGGAERFGFNDEELALGVASHGGEKEHVRVAQSMLQKCGCGEEHYECGAHWPTDRAASNAILVAGEKPRQVHNNCSGKHAGMLALSKHMNALSKDYVTHGHAVQQEIAKSMGTFCDVNLQKSDYAIDGCSVPTWAMPLENVATGFAKLAATQEGKRMIKAVRTNPFMVAGTDRFDTQIMKAVPRLFIKLGAEAVFCGMIEHANLGFALKCDDGGYRGAEVAIASALSQLSCWTTEERLALEGFSTVQQKNWRGITVGETIASA